MRLTILLFVILISSVQAEIEINEVMYSPGDGNEWIEIYNPSNSSVNLSGWLWEDNQNVDELGCCDFSPDCSLILKSLISTPL